MKRRKLLKCGLLALAGCNHGKTRATELKAGPFVVTVPDEWAEKAIIEKVRLQPLYSREEWRAFQQNPVQSKKPSYICRPEHWALRLPSALPKGVRFDRESAGDDPAAPQILIHKTSEWAVAFTDGIHEGSYAADLLRNLRRDMDLALTHDDPHLSPGYMDASLTFMCAKRRIDFTGGHGVRLLAQWTIEPALMREGELHYLFLGLSDDSTCQIIATFPLSLPGLPASDDKNHLGQTTDNYAALSESFDAYETDAKRWLEDDAQEINPSLQALDAMMQSLVATHWA